MHAAARALGHDLEFRSLPFPLLFQELAPGVEAEVGPVRVQSFETRHQLDACPHGFAIQAGRRRIVYSGDTGWFDDLPRHTRGADLFVCECTFETPVIPEHMAYDELVERAPRFACERLVLTHLGTALAERRGHLALETADDGLELDL